MSQEQKNPRLNNIAEYFLILALTTMAVWTFFRGYITEGFALRLLLVGGTASAIALTSSVSAGIFTVEKETAEIETESGD